MPDLLACEKEYFMSDKYDFPITSSPQMLRDMVEHVQWKDITNWGMARLVYLRDCLEGVADDSTEANVLRGQCKMLRLFLNVPYLLAEAKAQEIEHGEAERE